MLQLHVYKLWMILHGGAHAAGADTQRDLARRRVAVNVDAVARLDVAKLVLLRDQIDNALVH